MGFGSCQTHRAIAAGHFPVGQRKKLPDTQPCFRSFKQNSDRYSLHQKTYGLLFSAGIILFGNGAIQFIRGPGSQEVLAEFDILEHARKFRQGFQVLPCRLFGGNQ